MKKLFIKNTCFKVLSVMLVLLVLITSLSVKLNVKATSYVYDFWKNVIPSSEGITYKETYYNSDIFNANNPEEKLRPFSNLTDMEVYEDTIYVLDYSTQSFTLPTGKVEKFNLGNVIIINQDFRYTQIIDEFVITDEVKAKFDEFYHFDTPLDQITPAQVTSTEFVSIYEGLEEHATVVAGVVTFGTFTATDGATLNVYTTVDGKDVLIDPSEYTVSGTTVTFNDAEKYEGAAVYAHYITLDTPGRAPYVPYSQDATKAAVRLDSPQGITVTDKYILIADTENLRILKIDKFTLEVIDVYTGKSLAQLSIKDANGVGMQPRKIDFYQGKAYLCCYNGQVLKIDTTTLSIENKIQVGKNPEDLLVGARESVEEDLSKRNPADFALWFTTSKFQNQEMKWLVHLLLRIKGKMINTDEPWKVKIPLFRIKL